MMATKTFRCLCRTVRSFPVKSPAVPHSWAASNIFSRQICTAKAENVNLWEVYNKTKSRVEVQQLPKNRDPSAVYANNELDLREIDVYGFDYDYTLACYSDALHFLIYNLGREKLINDLRYPKEILNMDYDPGFAIRGLHCDVRRGILLKIDAFHNIQMGTAYRGLRSLPAEEVKSLYSGTHVAIENMSSFYGRGSSMHQLMDLFALPEMTLYSNVVEYFISQDITYDPEYVFYDVHTAVQSIHQSGLLHNEILGNLDTFMGKQTEVAQLLQRLSAAGKRLFLITNSGVNFVDRGMTYLAGPEWNQLFDVIITNARKPKFFNELTRPFRSYNHKLQVKSWKKVDKFVKGKFYQEGNFYQLSQLTGWYGSRVLYFGDHVYTDLADATLKHGWRTGAIIPELEDEIRTINTKMYKQAVCWLVALEGLVEQMQVYEDAESQKTVADWRKERDELRLISKNVFNPQFGSLFRTFHNPTYFTRRLNRFADVYMSSVASLLNYPLNHTFYPRRAALPHELEETGPVDIVT